ncbi:MAG: DNA primase [Bacteroidetes bacterium]|nr:DNA primase [Bacteroidota bacterium]
MRIPELKIEEIRASANILDVISGYVQMRKRGKNYIGLCPFHQEKTPSFTVSEDKQIYHCFGCHSGGNVFKFLMEYRNISFVESVQEVAEMLGIKLSFDNETYTQEQTENELLYEINVLAAKFFSNNLFNSEDGEFAREYLKNRKIKLATQRAFGLGFARPEWENLLFYLKENNVDIEKALQLGLIDKRDDGGYYDKFRGRLIFPILSPNGRVIAFGGRVFENDAKVAKYLNSPESIIYLKRKSLYGLFHSKDEIRRLDKVVLVEGYMDLISLYQGGIKNVVASSGTSLTEDQVHLLSRFTKNITVLFDADTAGEKASLRSIEILLKQDFDVRVVSLPENEDPDSFINKFGKDAFEEKINHAKNFLEYQTAQYEKRGDFQDPVKQTAAIRELVKSAALVNDELKRNILLKSISKKFNLREKLLEAELDNFLTSERIKEIRAAEFKTISNEQKKDGLADSIKSSSLGSQFEKEIIALLFEGNTEVIGNVFDHILPEDLSTEQFKKLAQMVYENYLNDVTAPSALIEKIGDEETKNFIFSLALNKEIISKRWEEYSYNAGVDADLVQYSRDVIKKFSLIKIEQQIKENNEAITQLENENEIMDLMRLNKELTEEKRIVQNGSGGSL